MLNSIFTLMATGLALIALLAVVVTVVDLAGTRTRREVAAQRRHSWESGS